LRNASGALKIPNPSGRNSKQKAPVKLSKFLAIELLIKNGKKEYTYSKRGMEALTCRRHVVVIRQPIFGGHVEAKPRKTTALHSYTEAENWNWSGMSVVLRD
jgi:hypothetical protein